MSEAGWKANHIRVFRVTRAFDVAGVSHFQLDPVCAEMR